MTGMETWMRHSTISRRGILVGVGAVAAAFAIRARPSSTSPLAVPPNRDFGGSPLITSIDQLVTSLASQTPPIVLDASVLADYRDQHIPGARHVWWQDTMELNSRWYGTVLKADDDQGTQTRRLGFLQRLGIDGSRPVVVYDRSDGQHAARICWFLTFLSVPASVLDGGFAGWLGANQPSASDSPQINTAVSPTVTPQNGFYLAAEQVNNRLAAGTGYLIDCRTANELADGRYAKTVIPNAVQIDRTVLLDGDQLLVGTPEIESVVPFPLTDPIYLIAETGVDCALPWLALKLAGAGSIEIVDGGLQQWIDQVDAPSSTA